MQGYGLSKSFRAIFFAFVPIVIFAVILIGTAQIFFSMDSQIVPFVLFIAIVAGAGWIVRSVAILMLFDRTKEADFYALCGARNLMPGSQPNSATWPFAKISATKTTLRFESPWNNSNWTNDGTNPRIQRIKKTSGRYGIFEPGTAPEPSVIFEVWPWRVKSVEKALISLGYNLIS